MGTVGEMVEVALAKRFEEDMEQTYCDIPELRSARNVMRSLGIWDAEVLECECKKDDFECEAFYPVTRNWRALGLEYGDRVRVIVLKEE